MRVDEFDAQQRTLVCRFCAAVGSLVRTKPNPQNNGIRVDCAACGKPHALRPTLWLKQTTKTHRKDYPMGQGLHEVWERYKGRCVVCTLPMYALLEVRIGISNHHVTERYDPTEYDCPIVPVCQACKPFVDARQKEAWRWYRRLQELKGEPVPPRSPGVPPARLSPDPVRPTREAPVGALEGFSDDDAHR